MPAGQHSKAIAALLALGLGLSACAPLSDAPTFYSPQIAKKAPQSFADWQSACEEWDEWDKAGPAYQIAGNSYYVGTCGISAILITGDEGHILIDGGTEVGGKLIAANIESLGFDLSDVKILLQSHEHFDHVAGLAFLQKVTDARLIASQEAAPVMASGMAAENDPQFGSLSQFPAARVDEVLGEDMQVTLGRLTLTAIPTPGHTLGALSWHILLSEGDVLINLVYADSLSPISSDNYRFSDHPEYVLQYRDGLKKLAALNCRILVTPHPSASGLLDQRHLGSSACVDYAAGIEKRLNDRLAQEQESKDP